MAWSDLVNSNLKSVISTFKEDTGSALYYPEGLGPGVEIELIFDDREDYLDVDSEVEINTRLVHALLEKSTIAPEEIARGDEIQARGKRYKVTDYYSVEGDGVVIILGYK